MNERVLGKNKTSATPSQAIQASSPPLHQGPSTSGLSESFGSNSNISKELGGIQPKTIRRSLNWQNISVEAPSRSDGRSSPGGIQCRQEEPGAVIGSRVSADSAQKPLIARAPLNGRNIPVEAPPRSAVSSTSPGGIQCLETSDVKEQQKSTESLQMQPEEAIQAKSSQDQLQEKEEQNKESVQTKLTVGAPGDKYEQEADSMAAKVMRMPDSAIQQPIQRQTGKETEAVQMQPLVNSITPVVQRSSGKEEEVQMKSGVQRASDGSSVASGSLENQLAGSKGGGSALPDDVRSFMEPRFGADFSNIKVHTDSNAVQMNKELGAQAFAHGSDIYYGAGKSPGKNELTAHELTHVVQQGGGAVQRKSRSGWETTGELTSAIGSIQLSASTGYSHSEDSSPPLQRKEGTTPTAQGKLDILKPGTEYLSGYTMDAVRRSPDQFTGFPLRFPQPQLQVKPAIAPIRTSVANNVVQNKTSSNSSFQFVDNRPEAIAQRKLQEMANNSPQAKQADQLQIVANHPAQQQQPSQKKASPEPGRRVNNTGLPDNLKSGIENLSGYSMDDVRVHYNSPKPPQLQALAYTQGTEIHVAPGQEEHLPHEAWHVVQQMQGRVKPTMQMKDKVNVNDDKGLEREADLMGNKAIQFKDNRPGAIAHRNLQEMGNNSSQLNIAVLQAFAPTKLMEKTIKDYKSHQNILKNGWNDDTIDQLVEWCKTEKQFNSFINNLSCQNWQLLSGQFQGDELPTKIMDSWVKYQINHMNVQTYDITFKGYKASGGTSWNTGESYGDWSGCYIATSRKQAEGYIGELGGLSGKASMWEISLKKPLPVKVFSGGFIDQSNISGEFKAKVLKKILKINDSEKLIKELGGEGFAYLGPGGEDGNELVVPWNLIPDYIHYERIIEYDVENFEIEAKREL